MRPIRIQLRRTKGFNLQEVSTAANGLTCVKVDRSTKWGNRYCVGGPVWRNKGLGKVKDQAEAVDLFRRRQAPHMSDIAQLRGKNLGCWCKVGDPCHGDVLLELANRQLAIT